MSSGISRDDWMRALDEAGVSVINDQDSLTVTEFAQMFSPPLDRTASWRRLEALVAAKKATKTRKTVADSSGRNINATSYKLIAAPKKKR